MLECEHLSRLAALLRDESKGRPQPHTASKVIDVFCDAFHGLPQATVASLWSLNVVDRPSDN